MGWLFAFASAENYTCHWANLWLCLSKPRLTCPEAGDAGWAYLSSFQQLKKRSMIWNGRRRVLQAGNMNAGKLKTKVHGRDCIWSTQCFVSVFKCSFICFCIESQISCTLMERWEADISLIPNVRVFSRSSCTLTSNQSPRKVLFVFLKEYG